MTNPQPPAMPGDGLPPPRGWIRLLLDPLFGSFFLGRTLSGTGIWIHNITAAVLTYELTNSAFMVGLVSVAQFLPQVLFAALTGSLADRGNRKRQVIAGRLIVTFGSAGLALWLWLVSEEGPATSWMIVLSALVVGLGFVTGGPAMHAMVPALVRPNEIDSAVTLNMLPLTLARAVGPALGAWISFGLGAPAAFMVAAACNLAFVLLLVRSRVPQSKREPGADTSMRAALSHVRQDRSVALLLVGVAAIGFGADPAITLAPSISESMGRGVHHAGTFAAMFGAGAGVAFLVIPVVRRYLGLARSATLGMLLVPAGLLVLVFAGTVWLGGLGFALAGMGMTMALTGLSAQLQQRVPDRLRGRIMALWSVGFLGSRPFAAALNGMVADLASVAVALVLAAALMLVAAWLCRPSRLAAAPPTAPPTASARLRPEVARPSAVSQPRPPRK